MRCLHFLIPLENFRIALKCINFCCYTSSSMKTSLFAILLGSAIFATQNASATLLVGFHDGSTPTNMDAGLAGFSGVISTSSNLSGWNSTDGSYGPDGGLTGAPTDTGNSFGFGGAGIKSITMAVTNSTGSDYTLDRLLFDFTNDNSYPTSYAVSYSVSAGPSVALIGSTASAGISSVGNNLNWTDVASGLIGITLNNASTITFKFDTTNGGALDNIALTGLSAIPEPASLLALGCLMGSGAFLRQRRRTAGAALQLA